jgi:hypothetical protein
MLYLARLDTDARWSALAKSELFQSRRHPVLIRALLPEGLAS